jgi:hypothetical protein
MIKGKWKTMLLSENADISSCMHLNQEMVKQILPILEHFAEISKISLLVVETGELPDQDTLVDIS